MDRIMLCQNTAFLSLPYAQALLILTGQYNLYNTSVESPSADTQLSSNKT